MDTPSLNLRDSLLSPRSEVAPQFWHDILLSPSGSVITLPRQSSPPRVSSMSIFWNPSRFPPASIVKARATKGAPPQPLSIYCYTPAAKTYLVHIGTPSTDPSKAHLPCMLIEGGGNVTMVPELMVIWQQTLSPTDS